MLRLPDGMRDRIKAAAESNNRSMNAEIVATLEEKYPAPLDIRSLDDLAKEMGLVATVEEKRALAKRFNDLSDASAPVGPYRFQVKVADDGTITLVAHDES